MNNNDLANKTFVGLKDIIFSASVDLAGGYISVAANETKSINVSSAIIKSGYSAIVYPFANGNNYFFLSIGYTDASTAYLNIVNKYSVSLNSEFRANIIWIKNS